MEPILFQHEKLIDAFHCKKEWVDVTQETKIKKNQDKIECLHAEVEEQKITEEILKESKTFSIQTCTNCGLQIWDNSYEEEFSKWLSELRSKEKLKVQRIRPMMYTDSIIKGFQKSIPGADRAAVVRGILSFYFFKVLKSRSFQDIAYSCYEKIDDKEKIEKGFAVKVSPVIGRSLAGVMKLSGKSSSILVAEILDLVLAPVSLSVEAYSKNYIDDLNVIVKSAAA